MIWVTIFWSMMAAAGLTLAMVHLVIWFKQRGQIGSLMFAFVATSAAGFVGIELALMRTQTPEQYSMVLRWGHVPVWVMTISLVLFTRLFLVAGRWWLGWTVIGLRTLSLVVNFIVPENLNFRQVTGLRRLSLLGETVSAPVGITNPWVVVGQLSMLLLIAYLVDATITVWRRGDHRRALLVGGSMSMFIVVGLAQSALMFWGVIEAPLLASIWYIAMLPAMGYELSRDVLRAVELAHDLRESEHQIDLAASAAHFGFWTWDIARDVIWATADARTHIGVSAIEPLDLQRFMNSLHPEDRPKVRQAIDRAMPGNARYQVEYRVVLSDGRTRWISARGGTELDGAGRPARMRGVTLDITDRKRSEERFQLAVNASPSAIVMVDQRGAIVLINVKTEEMFGYSQQELIGQNIEILIPHRFRGKHPSYRDSFFAAPQARAMGAGRELFARRKDDSEFPVEIGLNPIQTDEGLFVLAAIIDISARRYSEVEIARLREHLSHVGRVSMMGQLTTALAHELSQPLGAILRNAEAAELYLKSDSPDLEELRAIIGDIRRDDRRAGDVIDRLRGLLKRRDLEMCPLDVTDLLDEVAALLRSAAAARHVQVQLEIAPGLPMASGDRVHLQQVLLNLVLNAMDAVNGSPPEQRTVTLGARRCDGGDGRMIELSVCDRGHGINQDAIGHLFEPFFTTRPLGMGMGLSISRTIVEAHRGRIWSENNREGGATFRFTLPVATRSPGDNATSAAKEQGT